MSAVGKADALARWRHGS